MVGRNEKEKRLFRAFVGLCTDDSDRRSLVNLDPDSIFKK
jgi:hypothetical protein